ncbi:two-component system, response regulator YesN [Enterococcus sp. AZ194]|uniref:response regulator transcription factor n=1 Tax=Enterococcus sp. AZ194 TaxID=2774629 RepID=UPI003F234578
MNVLIVDDEAYIVEYLKYLIKWNDFGFSQVMGVTDPYEAKRIVVSRPVDLVVTDISMPEVSGLDLLKSIQEIDYPTKVFFLSSYSEFDYAQQAIKLNLNEYLLKPITKTTLEEAVKRVVIKMDSNKEKNQKHLFRQLLVQLADFKIEFGKMADCFCIFVKRPVRQEVTGNEWIYSEKVGDEEWGMMKETKLSNDEVTDYSPKFRLSNRQEVQECFYRFFYKEFPTYKLGSQESLEIRDYFIHLMTHKLVKHSAYEFYNQQKSKFPFLLNSYLFLFFQQREKLQGVQLFQLYEQESSELLIRAIESYQTMYQKQMTISEAIEKANQYIEKHLEQELSLESLAAKVFLNPAYFSTMYKQQTGINLSSYIQKVRLNRAVYLLTKTNLKVKDIGEMVGYPSIQYFNKLFKNRFGMTPIRYRKKYDRYQDK